MCTGVLSLNLIPLKPGKYVLLSRSGCRIVLYCIVLYCGRIPAANAPGRTAAEGLFYKPWSLVVPTCTARCLHQRP